jgi:hypothetical protein
MRVDDLPSPPNYPVYALARLDLPSNWTSIANAQIVDLRSVANPRSKMEQWNVDQAEGDVLNVASNFTYEIWPDNSGKSVYVPKWATKVYITSWIYSFIKGANITTDSAMRVSMYNGATRVASAKQSVFYDPTIASGGRGPGRYDMLMGAPMAIAAADRGTIRTFYTEATYANAAAMANNLATDTRTSVMIQLRFVEEAV